MLGKRRYPRYPVSLRLRLQLPTGELETSTEEISFAGFSAKCASLPEPGTTFTFVVHLPDGNLVSGSAAAVRITADGLAGFSCEFSPEQQSVWTGFIGQESAQGGVWRMISRWVSSPGETEAARTVREKGVGGVLRLHMVGENGEAYRIAFENHPSEAPEESPFAQASPRILEFAKRTISRILVRDVLLKLKPQATIEPVRLVEMKNGGYGYLVEHTGGKPGLMGLHGSELIVIETDGKPVFPGFTAEDLERISADTFRRETEPLRPPAASPPAAPVLREERFADAYAHQHVDTQKPVGVSPDDLRAMMQASQRVQKRTYGAREMKLFPDVWLEVQRPSEGGQPMRGFAMEDGVALCVFVLVGKGAPRVVKLEAGDEVASIRGGPES